MYDVHSAHGLYEANCDEARINEIADCGIDDVRWAIHEADGWCGTHCDVEPIVIVPHGETLPAEAVVYLNQPRD